MTKHPSPLGGPDLCNGIDIVPGLPPCARCHQPFLYGDLWYKISDGRYFHAVDKYCNKEKQMMGSGRWRKVDMPEQFLTKTQVGILKTYLRKGGTADDRGAPEAFTYNEPLISYLHAVVSYGDSETEVKSAAVLLLELLKENKTIEVWL